MGRKGESIYKRSDGRYEGRYIKGKYKNKVIYGYIYGSSYSETKEKLRNFGNVEIETQEINTFNEKIDKWLEYKKCTVKESTYSTYYAIASNKIRPLLGHYKINNLNKEIINSFIDKLSNSLSINTVHDMANILKQILKYNRMTDIDVKVPIKEHKSISVFTPKDIKKLERFALTYDNRFVFGIILSLYTGIRIGELCALKKSNFDMNLMTLSINHTIIRVKNADGKQKTKVICSAPKSRKSIRTIPIPDVLQSYLIHYLNEMNSDYYFLTNKTKAIEPRSYTNKYKKYLNYWGINHKKFHTTRHTFATKADETKMSTKALSEILGHSSASITQNLYIHPSLKYKRECINTIYTKKS